MYLRNTCQSPRKKKLLSYTYVLVDLAKSYSFEACHPLVLSEIKKKIDLVDKYHDSENEGAQVLMMKAVMKNQGLKMF